MKKILLLFLIVFTTLTASAQWNGIAGTFQRNHTNGKIRLNFGPYGVYSIDDTVATLKTTASNGITKTGNNFTLGGTITGSIFLGTGSNAFGITSGSGGNNVALSLNNGVSSISSINNTPGDQSFINQTATTATIDLYVNPGGAGSGNKKGITITPGTSGISVYDAINSKGFVYTADYSANYTSRSIPDVAYVLAHGGSGGGLTTSNFVTGEVPSGTIDGTNTTFTIANTPTTAIKLYLNGIRQKLSTDYTFSGTTITFTTAPTSGDLLLTDYSK